MIRMAEPAAKPAPAADEGGGEIRIQELWYTVLRHRWLVLAVAAVVMVLAFWHTSRQRPVYESEATLRIDQKDAGQNIFGDLGPLAGLGKGTLETEMLVLRSRQIAELVVDSLHLTVNLIEPQVPRSQVLRPLDVPQNATSGTFELRRQAGGWYTAHSENSPAALPKRVEPGVPFRVGEATLALEPSVAKSPPERIQFSISPFRGTAAALRAGLVVTRPDPRAQVVAVRFQSADPELASAVPNAVMEKFIHYKSTTSRAEARSTVDFLRSQVASYERDLGGAESNLRSFRESQGVVSLPDEASQQVQRRAALQAQMEEQRQERDALNRLMARVAEGTREGETSPYRQLASFPRFLSNQAVQNMLQSLTALENQRATLLVGRNTVAREVQGVNTRIKELELQLYELAQNYLSGLNSQIASVQSALDRFGTELQAIPAREVEFARLSRQTELLAEIYNLLQTRLKEAEIREAVEPGDVRVIDTALVPTLPIAPRPVRSMALATVFGVALGVAAAFARQAMDTKVRTREDVEGVTRGAPVLGMIPRIKGLSGQAAARRGAADGPAGEDRLVTWLDPHSPASEAYRALRTNITFANADRSPQVLVVTSAMPGDGKTTSAANLAITLAQQGTRTLLVDADLRRGVVHNVFGLKQEPGLTHVLVGAAPLEQAIQEVPMEGGTGVPLHVLASGVYPPNPAEILGSARMRELLATLRERYEMIVFDAAPLNLVTDAAVLGTSADATVLVARTGTTDKRALEYAASQVFHVGAPLGGVVLNDIDIERSQYYGYGYGYGYGYSYAPGSNGDGKPPRAAGKLNGRR